MAKADDTRPQVRHETKRATVRDRVVGGAIERLSQSRTKGRGVSMEGCVAKDHQAVTLPPKRNVTRRMARRREDLEIGHSIPVTQGPSHLVSRASEESREVCYRARRQD